MDEQRFDELTRVCASTISRRGALRVFFGGTAGGMLGFLGRGATAHHSPDHCRALGANCSRNQPCCPSANPCVEHVCLPTDNNQRRCVANNRPANTACPDDGDLCTADVCDGQGACVHPPAVICDSPDQCHAPGTCNPATGACDYEPLEDGTPCESGNLCTSDDTCQAGVCVPGQERPCAVGHVCNDVRCNPTSGVCDLLIPVPDNAPCQSNDPCRPNGSCQSGECIPGEPVVCEPLDECHDAGVCDQTTGACTNPAKPDGTQCSLGYCLDGACGICKVAGLGCRSSEECCASQGTTCGESVCGTRPQTCCRQLGEICGDACECCRPAGDCAVTPNCYGDGPLGGPNRCCIFAGGPCTTHCDCCRGSFCFGGICSN